MGWLWPLVQRDLETTCERYRTQNKLSIDSETQRPKDKRESESEKERLTIESKFSQS